MGKKIIVMVDINREINSQSVGWGGGGGDEGERRGRGKGKGLGFFSSLCAL